MIVGPFALAAAIASAVVVVDSRTCVCADSRVVVVVAVLTSFCANHVPGCAGGVSLGRPW